MKRVLVIMAAVTLLLGVSTLDAEELQIQVRNVPPQKVLLLKGQSSVQKIGQDMGFMFEQVYGYLGKKGIQPAGPPIALYFSEPGPEWAIGVAVPVPEGTPGQGTIESTTLPGGKMVSAMHIGPYEKLSESWDELSAWMKKSEYRPAGPGREVYILGPPQESEPAKFQTELLWPVL
jgi:effector-binding domain-containing protein